MQLREIEAHDRPALAAMLADTDNFAAEEVAVALELIDGAIADPDGSGYRAFVADDAGELLGYLCYGLTPMTRTTYDLYWIVTAKAARGRGVGRRLYEELCRRIAVAGGGQIRVETSSKENYSGTAQFYARLELPLVVTLADFYAPGDDLFVYYARVAAAPASD
jgi:ribosomal protein S18 acetylase RimI-like enzyme